MSLTHSFAILVWSEGLFFKRNRSTSFICFVSAEFLLSVGGSLFLTLDPKPYALNPKVEARIMGAPRTHSFPSYGCESTAGLRV